MPYAGWPLQWFDVVASHNRSIPLNLVGITFVIVDMDASFIKQLRVLITKLI